MSDAAQTGGGCLVDDDASVLRSMQYLLASDGLKVRAFNKPQEFLDYADKNPVAVVVTDVWMEGVTGLEILARMCALTPRPRVIVITAREDMAARATAMQIGPTAFFMKPFDDEAFVSAVRAALNQAPTAP